MYELVDKSTNKLFIENKILCYFYTSIGIFFVLIHNLFVLKIKLYTKKYLTFASFECSKEL